MFLAAAACGGGDDSASGDDTADVDAPGGDEEVTNVDCGTATVAATVTTSGFAFDPETTTISVGDVVHFMPATGHNVVNAEFNVSTGGDECFQFNVTGTYEISCTIHGFTGDVIVQ